MQGIEKISPNHKFGLITNMDEYFVYLDTFNKMLTETVDGQDELNYIKEGWTVLDTRDAEVYEETLKELRAQSRAWERHQGIIANLRTGTGFINVRVGNTMESIDISKLSAEERDEYEQKSWVRIAELNNDFAEIANMSISKSRVQ